MIAIPLFYWLLLLQSPGAARPILTLRMEFAFSTSLQTEPSFALYEDGRAIYWSNDTSAADRAHLAIAQLDSTTFAELVGLATSPAFLALNSSYDMAPGVTDLTFNIIDVWSPRRKSVTVRGEGDSVPVPFAALFNRLEKFDAPGARPWLPDSIRLTLEHVDRGCARFAPVAWPAALPLPRKRLHNQTVRYQVPIRFLATVRQLRQAYGNYDCTPVKIGRSYWRIWDEYGFPGDSLWVKH